MNKKDKIIKIIFAMFLFTFFTYLFAVLAYQVDVVGKWGTGLDALVAYVFLAGVAVILIWCVLNSGKLFRKEVEEDD